MYCGFILCVSWSQHCDWRMHCRLLVPERLIIGDAGAVQRDDVLSRRQWTANFVPCWRLLPQHHHVDANNMHRRRILQPKWLVRCDWLVSWWLHLRRWLDNGNIFDL